MLNSIFGGANNPFPNPGNPMTPPPPMGNTLADAARPPQGAMPPGGPQLPGPLAPSEPGQPPQGGLAPRPPSPDMQSLMGPGSVNMAAAKPPSVGQNLQNANQMLQNDSWDNLQSNPKFQASMKGLDNSIFKFVPNDSKPGMLDYVQNLRSQIANQIITPTQSQMGPDNQQLARLNKPYSGSSFQGLPKGVSSGMNHMEIANKFVGMSEGRNAPALQAFFKQTLHQNVDPRTTAWCAAFANGVLQKSGLTGTGSLMARSFLGYGKPVDAQNLKQGDVAVFGRGKAPYGHVGFVNSVNLKNGTVNILSGNQNNAVTLKNYAIGKAVGFRRIELPGK